MIRTVQELSALVGTFLRVERQSKQIKRYKKQKKFQLPMENHRGFHHLKEAPTRALPPLENWINFTG